MYGIKDRCIHRGVRFSHKIECYTRDTITCWYHGFTYKWDSGVLCDVIASPDTPIIGKRKVKSYPVRDEIERRLSTKVILENDANSAAMGEKWLGAGRQFEHMAMYTLGTGVGGGLIFNGSLWHGMTGMAGELGHFNVYADGHPCGCGSRGCLEQYASATAVVRMAREAIARGESTELEKLSHDEGQFTSRSIYNLAVQGEPAA